MIKQFLLSNLAASVINLRRLWLNVGWLINRKMGRKTLIVHTKQGLFRISTGDNAIGHSLYTRGEFEYGYSLKAMDFLRRHQFVRPENITFQDIGANIGIISIGLLRQAKIAHAIAVEPEVHNFKRLTENVRLNDLSEAMICLPLALGDRKAMLEMEISPDNPGDHRIREAQVLTQAKFYSEDRREIVQVASLPLDEMLTLPEVSRTQWSFENAVVWIDVQGYEGYVFKGAQKFFSNGVATVSEIWPYGILRAGMSLDAFTDIVTSIWSDYWVLRGERFIRYPISMFDRYLDEIGEDNGYGNIVFTKR